MQPHTHTSWHSHLVFLEALTLMQVGGSVVIIYSFSQNPTFTQHCVIKNTDAQYTCCFTLTYRFLFKLITLTCLCQISYRTLQDQFMALCTWAVP